LTWQCALNLHCIIAILLEAPQDSLIHPYFHVHTILHSER
jgi:hypothetical protein